MSYQPPSGRSSRISRGGLFGSPDMPMGPSKMGLGDMGLANSGMFAPTAPTNGKGIIVVEGQKPGAQPVMPMPTEPMSSGAYTPADQAYGHDILIPSIIALMTGKATTRPPDPNMMFNTRTGQWTSDLSAYTGK